MSRAAISMSGVRASGSPTRPTHNNQHAGRQDRAAADAIGQSAERNRENQHYDFSVDRYSPREFPGAFGHTEVFLQKVRLDKVDGRNKPDIHARHPENGADVQRRYTRTQPDRAEFSLVAV